MEMNWKKWIFHWGKWSFEPNGLSVHITELSTFIGSAA